MPEKDGSDDKKSTKSVVNKKQKQLMNKEQLDLTSVAESFGGQIVGEPVELDEEPLSLATTIGGIALWKLLAAGGATSLVGADSWQKAQGKKGFLPDLSGVVKGVYDKVRGVGDGIGKDVVNPGALDTKDGTKDGTKDLVRPGSTTKNLTKTNVIAKDIATTNTAVKTRKLPKPFKFRMPKLKDTQHNVGRRVNPQ